MLVIFDLDDTLIDTLSAQIAARERIMRHFALEPSNAAMDRWQRAAQFFDPEDFAHVLPLVIPGLHSPVVDVEDLRRLYWACEVENITLKPGVAALLRRLEELGTAMALVTGGPREVQERKVKRLGLEKYFARGAIVYSDGPRHPRSPNPAPLRQALRLCAVDPAAAYHVGDRLSDVIAAHLARVRSVLVNAPSLAADPPAADIALDIETPLHTIDHIVDLLSIVVPAPARRQHGDRLHAGAV